MVQKSGMFFSPVNSRINYRTTYELVSRISSINSIIAFHGNIEFHQPRLYRKPGEAVAEAMDEEEALTLNGARQLARKGTANLIDVHEYLSPAILRGFDVVKQMPGVG